MRVVYRDSAEPSFLAMPKDVQRRFRDALRILERDPSGRLGNLDVEPIRGSRNLWRLKILEYRGVFRKGEGKIVFLDFGHGHDVYLRFGWP